MARSKYNQRSARRVAVDVGATGIRPASRGTVVVLVLSVLAAVWAVAMMTAPGRIGYYYFFAYAEFYMGVITLVALSITIMVGLVATDRLVLSIRQRVLLQSTHRTTGLIAVVALAVHIWTKLVEQHIRWIDVVVPFLFPYNRLAIGFGTVSALVMVLVMGTGLARARFVGRGRPWMWRCIHAISYLMWPIALVHGLSAGRSAKAWVVVSYVVCVLLVLVGLAVRLSVRLNRRKDFSSTVTGTMRPAGSLVPTASPPVQRRDPYQPGYGRAAVGRHSRAEFVDLADPNYLPPDDTPTLVDMASRRERRAAKNRAAQSRASQSRTGNSRVTPRGARRRSDELADEAYWSQLRGEAN